MSLLKKVLLSAVFFSITTASTASAYTGSFLVTPATSPGPSGTSVTKFDFDTQAGVPQVITTNLFYVQKLIITSSIDLHSHVIIKEYPPGSSSNFDIIVPKPVQDALVTADIYIWAPDQSSLTVRHDHVGAPTVYESAVKVQPVQTNASGSVLWKFTVTSFSSFFWNTGAATDSGLLFQNLLNLSTLVFVLLASVAAPIALRRNG